MASRVSTAEVAYLVIAWLKESHFVEAARALEYEAASLLARVVSPGKPAKALQDILSEYAELMYERRHGVQSRPRPFAHATVRATFAQVQRLLLDYEAVLEQDMAPQTQRQGSESGALSQQDEPAPARRAEPSATGQRGSTARDSQQRPPAADHTSPSRPGRKSSRPRRRVISQDSQQGAGTGLGDVAPLDSVLPAPQAFGRLVDTLVDTTRSMTQDGDVAPVISDAMIDDLFRLLPAIRHGDGPVAAADLGPSPLKRRRVELPPPSPPRAGFASEAADSQRVGIDSDDGAASVSASASASAASAAAVDSPTAAAATASATKRAAFADAVPMHRGSRAMERTSGGASAAASAAAVAAALRERRVRESGTRGNSDDIGSDSDIDDFLDSLHYNEVGDIS